MLSVLLVFLVLLPLSLGLLGAPAQAEEPLTVDDAVLRWAVSEQTNARSHNPTAINFMSAGVADPGRGGIHLPRGKWQARAGNVEIQKRQAGGRWARATWAGLGTDARGARIGLYGPFSGHRVSFTGGTGTVDPATDSARVQWRGTFTVVYYGGNTVFTLSDPVLEVVDGVGTLKASLGGWAAGREDPTLWEAVPRRQVTVADLPEADLTQTGTVLTPAYSGVEVDGTVPQHRSGEHWGSFPASMVDALRPMGTDQFWYSTGTQADWTKVPAPILLGYAGEVPDDPTPPKSPPPQPDPPQNTPTPSPSPSPTPAPTDRPTDAPPPPTGSPPAADVPQVDVPVGPLDAQGPEILPISQPVQYSAQTPLELTAAASTERDGARIGWWVGGVLLLASLFLLAVPARSRP